MIPHHTLIFDTFDSVLSPPLLTEDTTCFPETDHPRQSPISNDIGVLQHEDPNFTILTSQVPE
jgi:hypothetical protein